MSKGRDNQANTTRVEGDGLTHAELSTDTSGGINQHTHSALYAPSLRLVGCVRAYLSRSTLGVALTQAQRYSHFPASPLCGISWMLEGEAIIVRQGGMRLNEPMPQIMFSGPRTVPSVSYNPAAASAFMVGFLPDAWHAMTGVDVSAWVNGVVDVRQLLDKEWLAMVRRVAGAADGAQRIGILEDFLAPRWASVRSSALGRSDRYRYWVEGLVLRAATSGVGSSVRQVQRRIKQAAGLPLRDLQRIARMEDAFFKSRSLHEQGGHSFAAVASDAGLADQSHLCREIRRISGLSPLELAKAIESQESFWVYRIWD